MSTHANLAIQVNMNVIQPGKVEYLANDERLSLGQVERAAIVGLHDTVQELLRYIIPVVLRRADSDGLAAVMSRRQVAMLVAELEHIAWYAGGQRHRSVGHGGQPADGHRDSTGKTHGD